MAPTSRDIALVDYRACGGPRVGVDRALPGGLGLGLGMVTPGSGDRVMGQLGPCDGARGTNILVMVTGVGMTGSG